MKGSGNISSDNILFASKRNTRKPLVFTLIAMIIYMMYVETGIIKMAMEYKTDIDFEKSNSKKLKEEWEKTLELFNLKNPAEKQKIEKIFIEERKIMEINRRKGNKSMLYLISLFMALLLGFFIILLYHILVNNKVKFYLTNRQLVINRQNKQEHILLNDIQKIEIMGKVNRTGLLYNKDLDAIVIKTRDKTKSYYILAPKGAYTNLCEFIEILQQKFPEKLVLKPVYLYKNKLKALFWGIVFGLYIIFHEYSNKNIYVLIFGMLLIGSSIMVFNRKDKCPAIYKTFVE